MVFRSSFNNKSLNKRYFDCSSSKRVQELYRAVSPYALSKIVYMVGCQQIAMEIVQEVFLKLWSKGLQFNSTQEAYSWVYTCCHRAAIDHMRSKANNLCQIDSSQLIMPETVSDRVANGQVLAKIAADLSSRQLEILAYRFIDGHKLCDIADMMSLSTKTIQRELQQIRILSLKIRGTFNE